MINVRTPRPAHTATTVRNAPPSKPIIALRARIPCRASSRSNMHNAVLVTDFDGVLLDSEPEVHAAGP